MLNKKTGFVFALFIVVLMLAACAGSTPEAPSEPEATPLPPTSVPEPAPTTVPEPAAAPLFRGYRIAFVTHGGADSAFWPVVIRGAEQAAQDMGVVVDYKAPETFDLAKMAMLIDEAVASNPDGLVVSIPDADVLAHSIRVAIDAGIPVFSINSGSEIAERLGAIGHIGQLEYQAGYEGGKAMSTAGARKAICLNQEVGNVALDLRCQAFADALAADFVESRVVPVIVDDNDPAGSETAILDILTEELEADPEINAILALGNTAAKPMINVVRQNSQFDDLLMGTFDLSPEILAAVRDGEVLFAIDQQPYMQGYLPIVYVALYLDNLNVPGGPVVLTGPGMVTQENADEIIELSAQGTR